MHGAVYSEQAQCQDCYKCVRGCPVKAIRVTVGHATVMPERCIACGACVTACPSGAKVVRDDTGLAIRLLESKTRVVVSLAPSFVSEFPGVDPLQLIAAIRKLGFHGVSETALGAQQVSAWIAQELAEAYVPPPLVSSPPRVATITATMMIETNANAIAPRPR